MPDKTLTPLTVAIAALGGVCGIVVIAISTTVQVGVLVLAVFSFAGAIARIVMPASAAFRVRRRAVDVTVLLVFAAALGYLGLTTPLT